MQNMQTAIHLVFLFRPEAVKPSVSNLEYLCSYFRSFKELETNATYLYTISI